MPTQRLSRKNLAWTPNLAYAVGLITTDGSLSKDKRHISLTSTDIDLLETFRNCLKKKNQITTNPSSTLSKKNVYRVQFGDVVLYDWLVQIGLSSNKSLTLGTMNVNKRYFRDFLRGHLDGDGSVIYYKDRYNTYLKPQYVYDRLFVYFMSASEKHIDWLRETIFKFKHIKGSINKRAPSKTQKGRFPTYRLKFSTKEAKIILNWIYYKKDLPYLERKHKIAKPFIQN